MNKPCICETQMCSLLAGTNRFCYEKRRLLSPTELDVGCDKWLSIRDRNYIFEQAWRQNTTR